MASEARARVFKNSPSSHSGFKTNVNILMIQSRRPSTGFHEILNVYRRKLESLERVTMRALEVEGSSRAPP